MTDLEVSVEKLAGASISELVNDIETKHHVFLRQELPKLAELSKKVATVHGESRPDLVKLHNLFEGLSQELLMHMEKEERILFPFCKELEKAKVMPQFHCGHIRNPITQMLREHDNAIYFLGQMRQTTQDFTPTDDDCKSCRALYEGLALLEEDLVTHIHKENNMLFPKALERADELGGGGCGCGSSACH